MTEHKQVAAEGKLSPSEVKDDKDSTPRVGGKLSGKRVRAVGYQNATTTKIRRVDFKTASNGEVDHPDVTWDFRTDDYTVPVGDRLSQEAADFLTKNYPETFEYINDGE